MQIEEPKEYFKDLNNETITLEIPQKQIPTPRNIIQPLLWHQEKPENGQVIREEQDVKDLHNEIREVETPPQVRRQRNNEAPKKDTKENTLKKKKGNYAKKPQKKKKGNEKQINYNDTSSDELDKLEESEEEKGNEKEPPFNIENESKEILRTNWKNEMEMHVNKTVQRITSRHFKKIRSGLNLVMNRVAALFRIGGRDSGLPNPVLGSVGG
jgi:hypothetical protein